MLFQKREFIPIPSLKDDFIVFHMKKSTSAKSELIFPFHYRPFSIFKNILYNTFANISWIAIFPTTGLFAT